MQYLLVTSLHSLFVVVVTGGRHQRRVLFTHRALVQRVNAAASCRQGHRCAHQDRQLGMCVRCVLRFHAQEILVYELHV